MKTTLNIKLLPTERLNDFFVYLKDHLSDNGSNGTPLFLPISKADLDIPPGIVESFSKGQSVSVGEPGWRRILVALNSEEEIVGHIDLKAHAQSYTNHRAVMGMGVHRDYRKEGLGTLLIEALAQWTKNETTIERIDLWVLAKNRPAIRLYEKLGFQKIGEVEDMFRIDGQSYDYIMMTQRVV